jgi:branched-subunit amino acid aminotransferase/4-amino-4-deoxychorismate lyase
MPRWDTLFTAPTGEILDGITKKVLWLEEASLFNFGLGSELVEASKWYFKRNICGTAAVVNPIVRFSYQDVYYELLKKIHIQTAIEDRYRYAAQTGWRLHWLDCKV